MENVLDKLRQGGDLRDLDINELATLCSDIRQFLVEHVSRTGGHLASNLGVVELTVAIHKVFDLPNDKLIFDVGHQSYVHKLLSGRAEQFDTLRQFGGMSGFPKRSESDYDAFDTGHSSTSVSAALGMARARDIIGSKNNIIALFGDGALTGGEIYEAINDAGHTKTPLILILNDNEMSISKNVGAVSKHLRNIRINRVYFHSKKRISDTLDNMPVLGKPIRSIIEAVKRPIRYLALKSNIFEDLGFKYIGPIDGHDIESIITCLEYAKTEKKPTLLHVCTQKGKGYSPAEKNPSAFHGVGVFNPTDGIIPDTKKNYSEQFGESLMSIAKDNDKVVAITCAMPEGTGLMDFARTYKDRFFDVGIAEQHGVTFAAGMAAAGLIPVIPIYSTFLQRAYDQVLHDVCLQNLHVVFPVDRAGIVGPDGETHQGIYDISYLSSMPNMTILSPSSFKQLDAMMKYAVNECSSPIAIRYPRGNTETNLEFDEFEPMRIYRRKDGLDVTIIASGRMLKRAEEIECILAKQNISVEILEMPTIFPIDEEELCNAVENSSFIISLEDNVLSGGFGEHIGNILFSNGVTCKFHAFGFPLEPIVCGTIDELDKRYGLDAVSVSQYITEELKKWLKSDLMFI